MFTMPTTAVCPAPPLNRTHTADPARPHAPAVAITGGRITKVGHDEVIAPHVRESRRVIDAHRRRIVCGLNDSLRYTGGGGTLKTIINTGCAGGDMWAKAFRTACRCSS